MGALLIPLFLAAVAYGTWVVVRFDILRALQGTRHVRATITAHQPIAGDGLLPVYTFTDRGRRIEVVGRPSREPAPPPLGTSELLLYPAKRPDMARTERTFPRAVIYIAMAAGVAVFGDLLFGWL